MVLSWAIEAKRGLGPQAKRQVIDWNRALPDIVTRRTTYPDSTLTSRTEVPASSMVMKASSHAVTHVVTAPIPPNTSARRPRRRSPWLKTGKT